MQTKQQYQQNQQSTEQQIAKQNLHFGAQLYSQLKSSSQLFFSPFNISTALAMTCLGADKNTLSQMKSTLKLTQSDEIIHKAFSTFEKSLNKKNQSVEIHSANKVYPQKDLELQKEFVKQLSQLYNVELDLVDYKGNTDQAIQKINQWVEGQTNNKIQNLLSKNTVDKDTRMVLVSAIYFKGLWQSQFKKTSTQKATFYGENNENPQIDLMYQESKFKYLSQPEFQALELPYKGENYSMVVLLPKKKGEFAQFSQKINQDVLNQVEQSLQGKVAEKVQTYIPKFKMTYDFSLKEQLKAMGMVEPFSENADFSRMTGNMELQISDVIHKAFVEVNEEGTEAAAATAVVMMRKCAMISKGPVTPVFRADRSFMFYIRENQFGNILFMGNYLGQNK